MVRITGGQYKGIPLTVPRGIRATQAKVRQAIFNILGPAIEGARVLDGFAGSGAVGCEALSRGAAYVAFIDSEAEPILAIRDNLARLDRHLPSDAWRVVHAPVDRGLQVLAEHEPPFHVVLFDPPYDSPEGKKSLNTLAHCAILTRTAIVGVQHDHRTVLPLTIGPLQGWKRHRYGDTVLSLYQGTAAEPGQTASRPTHLRPRSGS